MVYSTCSLSPLENDDVIEKALKKSKVAVSVMSLSLAAQEETKVSTSSIEAGLTQPIASSSIGEDSISQVSDTLKHMAVNPQAKTSLLSTDGQVQPLVNAPVTPSLSQESSLVQPLESSLLTSTAQKSQSDPIAPESSKDNGGPESKRARGIFI